jgi:hypothetical protein
MRNLKIVGLLAALTFVAGCEGQSQTERALAGGLAGGLVATATGNDVGTTAALGALAGMASCGVAGAPACR